MKVKLYNGNVDTLNYKINEFIKDKEIIDIKLSTGKYGTFVLIMYK